MAPSTGRGNCASTMKEQEDASTEQYANLFTVKGREEAAIVVKESKMLKREKWPIMRRIRNHVITMNEMADVGMEIDANSLMERKTSKTKERKLFANYMKKETAEIMNVPLHT